MMALIEYVVLLIALAVSCCLAQQTTLIESLIAPSASWTSISVSSSGQFIVAVSQSDGIYTSNSYGYNWTRSFSNNIAFTSVACSANGEYFLAGSSTGLYLSSNFGETWSLTGPSSFDTYSVTMSASAQWMFAVGSAGLAVQNDTAQSPWFIRTESKVFYHIDCSSSGQYLVATTGSNGAIYSSNDFGAYFNLTDHVGGTIADVAMSSSGNLVTVLDNYDIYVSVNGSDYADTKAPAASWSSVAMSSSGLFQVATVDYGDVYYSTNFGENWKVMTAPAEFWSSVATSSSGQYIFATVFDGGIYYNYFAPTSQPSSSPSTTPTADPTSVPTLNPVTSWPTSRPSSYPTAFPTFDPQTYSIPLTVLSRSANVTTQVNGLGFGSEVFVQASILVSYLDQESKGYIEIQATNDEGATPVIVSSYCAPTQPCTSIVCQVNINITSVVSPIGGGSVALVARTMNASQQVGEDILCTYKGTQNLQFAMSYSLSYSPIPTGQPTEAPTVLDGLDLVVDASPNTPFYIIAACVLVIIGFGVYIIRLRDKNPGEISRLNLTSTCSDLALIGYHLASELFYIVVLFDQGFTYMAVAIILVRLVSVGVAFFFLYLLFGPVDTKYSNMLNKHHLFNKASVYAVLVVIMMLDQSMVRYLPWSPNIYTAYSRGFPDQNVFKWCILSKFFQLIGTLVVQLTVLFHYDYYLFTNSSDSVDLALVLLYLVSSVLTLVLFTITNGIRLVSGKEADTKSREERTTAAVKVQVRNVIHSHDRGAEMLETKRPSELTLFPEFVSYAVLEERESLLKDEIRNQRSEYEELKRHNNELERIVIEMKDHLKGGKAGNSD